MKRARAARALLQLVLRTSHARRGLAVRSAAQVYASRGRRGEDRKTKWGRGLDWSDIRGAEASQVPKKRKSLLEVFGA